MTAPDQRDHDERSVQRRAGEGNVDGRRVGGRSVGEGSVDGRSVGELLLDVELLIRQVLMDLPDQDAPTLARTWGEVVQSAADLWSTLPEPARGTTRPLDVVTMSRLDTMTQALHRTQIRQGWPGDGHSDERLLHVAQTLTRAADLVQSHGAHIRATDPDVRADLDAARMRIMHSLYIGAHGVGAAVRQHAHQADQRPSGKTGPGSRARPPRNAPARDVPGRNVPGRDVPRSKVPTLSGIIDRLAAFEQLAGAYVGNRYASVVHGEQVAGPPGTQRLQQALIGWDIQAHRTLAAAPAPPNLSLAATTQARIAIAAVAILHAGARTGRLEEDDYQHRLAPALDDTADAWTHTASRWAEMTTPADRTDPALVAAANELRAAIHEVTHDKTTPAHPDVIAGRVDLGEAGQHLQQALSAAVDVACVTREIATTNQNLTGPAAAMSHRANTDLQALEDLAARGGHAKNGGRAKDVVWVSPGDVHANRLIAIPAPVRASLIGATDTLVQTASNAMSAAACLDRGPHQVPRVEAATSGGGRVDQERALTFATPPRSVARER